MRQSFLEPIPRKLCFAGSPVTAALTLRCEPCESVARGLPAGEDRVNVAGGRGDAFGVRIGTNGKPGAVLVSPRGNGANGFLISLRLYELSEARMIVL